MTVNNNFSNKYAVLGGILIIVLLYVILLPRISDKSVNDGSQSSRASQTNLTLNFDRFPVYPGASLTSSDQWSEDDDTFYTASWTSSETADGIIQWYEETIEEMPGWKVLGVDSESKDDHKLVAFSDPTTFILTIKVVGEESNIQLKANHDTD